LANLPEIPGTFPERAYPFRVRSADLSAISIYLGRSRRDLAAISSDLVRSRPSPKAITSKINSGMRYPNLGTQPRPSPKPHPPRSQANDWDEPGTSRTSAIACCHWGTCPTCTKRIAFARKAAKTCFWCQNASSTRGRTMSTKLESQPSHKSGYTSSTLALTKRPYG